MWKHAILRITFRHKNLNVNETESHGNPTTSSWFIQCQAKRTSLNHFVFVSVRTRLQLCREKRSGQHNKDCEQWVNEMRRASAIATHKWCRSRGDKWKDALQFYVDNSFLLFFSHSSPRLSNFICLTFRVIFIHSFIQRATKVKTLFARSLRSTYSDPHCFQVYLDFSCFFFPSADLNEVNFEQAATEQKQSVCCLFCNRRRHG